MAVQIGQNLPQLQPDQGEHDALQEERNHLPDRLTLQPRGARDDQRGCPRNHQAQIGPPEARRDTAADVVRAAIADFGGGVRHAVRTDREGAPG
jgi:hypothetical protein